MNSSSSEPGYWPRTETMRVHSADRIWGIGWQGLRADTFDLWRQELTRTPKEYSLRGGEDWSPSLAELAARLHVDVDLVHDWAQHGIDEPWEIAVVRAYARTGIALAPGQRVSAHEVERALGRVNNLQDASAQTGVPLSMLQHHLEVGAPAKTHGRMYTLMASDRYREASGLSLESTWEPKDIERVRRMAENGATHEAIALHFEITQKAVSVRMKKLGIVSMRASIGGRTLAPK